MSSFSLGLLFALEKILQEQEQQESSPPTTELLSTLTGLANSSSRNASAVVLQSSSSSWYSSASPPTSLDNHNHNHTNELPPTAVSAVVQDKLLQGEISKVEDFRDAAPPAPPPPPLFPRRNVAFPGAVPAIGEIDREAEFYTAKPGREQVLQIVSPANSSGRSSGSDVFTQRMLADNEERAQRAISMDDPGPERLSASGVQPVDHRHQKDAVDQEAIYERLGRVLPNPGVMSMQTYQSKRHHIASIEHGHVGRAERYEDSSLHARVKQYTANKQLLKYTLANHQDLSKNRCLDALSSRDETSQQLSSDAKKEVVVVAKEKLAKETRRTGEDNMSASEHMQFVLLRNWELKRDLERLDALRRNVREARARMMNEPWSAFDDESPRWTQKQEERLQYFKTYYAAKCTQKEERRDETMLDEAYDASDESDQEILARRYSATCAKASDDSGMDIPEHACSAEESSQGQQQQLCPPANDKDNQIAPQAEQAQLKLAEAQQALRNFQAQSQPQPQPQSQAPSASEVEQSRSQSATPINGEEREARFRSRLPVVARKQEPVNVEKTEHKNKRVCTLDSKNAPP
ncbi:hypothetical protein N0V83_007698 [Neocucurbitaria cava]|uniref:Uncharacterized protein n=1 Tax=Neocucurbitaria cava TaxID=798079 RepID=A0A9W8Y4S9_9PLEO|nr:hypothetical protein N0V83_007698 [Neocucurbitaria cava]